MNEILSQLEEQGWETMLCDVPVRVYDNPVSCGKPLDIGNPQYSIGWYPSEIVSCPERCFRTQATGSSMQDAAIDSGDWLTVETGVRVRHIPSGIMVENTETRSQFDNRENALRILKSRLYDIELKKRQEKQAELEGQKKRIEWGSQIRNYVLHPYKMVKDLRTGYSTADTQGVLDGDINEFMKTFLMGRGSAVTDDEID